MAEYAPGIPSREISPIREVAKEGPNEVWAFSLSKHEARKAGPHYDLRLIDPDTDEAHSFAGRKWPEPGEKTLMVPQPTHTGEYARRKGTWEIPSGYGAGKVTSRRLEPAEVVESTPQRLRFNLYGPGQKIEQYSLIRTPNGMLFANHSDTSRQVGGAKGYAVPDFKPKYKEVDFDRVDPTDNTEVMQAKIDGAHAILGLQSGKPARVFSYRDSKRQPVIEHTQRFPDWNQRVVPPGMGNTLLRAELWASDEKGKAIGPNQLAALLNTDVWKARIKQEQDRVRLRLSAIDVQQYKGRPAEGLSRDRKDEILRRAAQTLGWLERPTEARTAPAKRKLLRAIKSGRLPETGEGVVLFPEEGPPIKAKITPELDGPIVGTFPGKGKYEGAGVGGFLVRDPQMNVVNRVGSGLTDRLRRQAHENPGFFRGLWAKVKSRGRTDSGKLRDPRFRGFHLDKSDPEKLDKIQKLAAKSTEESIGETLPAIAGGLAMLSSNNLMGLQEAIGSKIVERAPKLRPAVFEEDKIRKLIKKMDMASRDLVIKYGPEDAYHWPGLKSKMKIYMSRGKGLPPKIVEKSVGSLGGITIRPDSPLSSIAHELGHAQKMSKYPRIGRVLRGVGRRAPILGLGAAALLPAGEESDYAKYAPLVGAGAYSPILAQEAAASVRGVKGLRGIGMGPKTLSANKRRLARSFATYLPGAAIAAGVPYLAYKARKWLKKKNKEQGDR